MWPLRQTTVALSMEASNELIITSGPTKMDQGGNFMYEEDSTMAETDDDNDKPNVSSEQQDETA